MGNHSGIMDIPFVNPLFPNAPTDVFSAQTRHGMCFQPKRVNSMCLGAFGSIFQLLLNQKEPSLKL